MYAFKVHRRLSDRVNAFRDKKPYRLIRGPWTIRGSYGSVRSAEVRPPGGKGSVTNGGTVKGPKEPVRKGESDGA
jgi:hypothetical protein